MQALIGPCTLTTMVTINGVLKAPTMVTAAVKTVGCRFLERQSWLNRIVPIHRRFVERPQNCSGAPHNSAVYLKTKTVLPVTPKASRKKRKAPKEKRSDVHKDISFCLAVELIETSSGSKQSSGAGRHGWVEFLVGVDDFDNGVVRRHVCERGRERCR